jgi:leucyl-tRNA synthetase
MAKQNITVMLPYPSGDSLHIGHYYNYAIIDSYCRYLRFKGIEVFQPFGFDSHGLPTELFAQKVGKPPIQVAKENIEKFNVQMVRMNTCYETLLSTCDESYQKWTQWLFLKLKEHGLAYKAFGEVNWCPSCETVLAREQVKNDYCERCSSKIEKKQLKQWYFKITDYKDRLIKNLDIIDYPKPVINAQRAWLENQHDWCVSRQRKFGCPIPIEGETDTLDTFVDSSFYFIRYCDPNNENELCSKEKYKQVDLYIGGSEHACGHLIFARFINMFLYDIGIVPNEEPFKKYISQGMILNEGEKMSKSKGNTISPDDYSPDELRFYLMFIGHYFDGGSWSDKNISGIRRFIGRMKEWMSRTGEETLFLDKFKEQIFDHTEKFKFNKVVSEFMILLNNNKSINLTSDSKEEIISLLEIYMPGIREKLHQTE